MKKNGIKYLLFFIITFALNITVSNALTCVYGQLDGNKFNKLITLTPDDDVPIDLSGSPMLTENLDPSIDSIEKKSEDTGATHLGEVDWNLNYDIRYAVDTSLGCPTKILYIKLAGWFLGDATGHNNIAIVDELNEADGIRFALDEFDADTIDQDDLDDIEEGKSKFTLVLKGVDKNNPDSDDKYDCSGFSAKLNYLKKVKNNEIPELVKNPGGCDNNTYFNEAYNEFYQLCTRYISSMSYVDNSGSNLKSRSCMKACSDLRDTVDDMCDAKTSGYCGSLGNKFVNWIFRIIRIIRYALPALLIILSILDFIKAIAEEDESKMKEATKRFIRRLIAVALLFIIPFILNFLLKIFNIPGLNASNPFCAN